MDALEELEAMKAALAPLEKLEPEARGRAIKWIAEALGVALSTQGSQEEGSPSGSKATGQSGGQGGDKPTAKQFLADRRPTTDVERITCLAYYLAKYRGVESFKTKELTELNTEAAGLKFGNPSQAADNAMKKGAFLAQAGKGKRQITLRGEKLVEALPDREAVKAALDAMPLQKKRATRKSTKKVAKS